MKKLNVKLLQTADRYNREENYIELEELKNNTSIGGVFVNPNTNKIWKRVGLKEWVVSSDNGVLSSIKIPFFCPKCGKFTQPIDDLYLIEYNFCGNCFIKKETNDMIFEDFINTKKKLKGV